MGPGAALTALARFEPGSWWVRVLIGVGFAVAAALVRLVTAPLYGSITGFMILLPGVLLAWQHGVTWATLLQPGYGRTLTAKLLLFVVVMIAASIHGMR